jgi:hypothetical protein
MANENPVLWHWFDWRTEQAPWSACPRELFVLAGVGTAMLKIFIEWIIKKVPRFAADSIILIIALTAFYYFNLVTFYAVEERRAKVLEHLQGIYSWFSPLVLVPEFPVQTNQLPSNSLPGSAGVSSTPSTEQSDLRSGSPTRQARLPGDGQFRVYVQYLASRPDLRTKAQAVYSVILRLRFENARIFAPDPLNSPRGNLVVFYHQEDRAAAEALAAGINTNIGASGPTVETLLGSGAAPPPRGALSVWIAN